MHINIYIPGVSFEDVIAKFMPRYEAFSPVAKEKFREGFEKELLNLVQDRLAIYADNIELEIGGSAQSDRIKVHCTHCGKDVPLRREWNAFVTSYVGQYPTGGFFPIEGQGVCIDESVCDQISGFYCPECGAELFDSNTRLKEYLEKSKTVEATAETPQEDEYTSGQFFEDYIEDSAVFECMPEMCWDYITVQQQEVYDRWKQLTTNPNEDKFKAAEEAVRYVLEKHGLNGTDW